MYNLHSTQVLFVLKQDVKLRHHTRSQGLQLKASLHLSEKKIWKILKRYRLCSYFPVDVVVTAAVMAILVRVSREPVDDFLVLTPLTVLLSITADVLSGGGGKTLVFTRNKDIINTNN